MAMLSDWFAGNSLLRVLKLSLCTPAQEQAFRLGRERSFEYRVGMAVFVRGCSHLGSAAVRNVAEYLYGVGAQSSKFLKYKTYSGHGAGGSGRLKLL